MDTLREAVDLRRARWTRHRRGLRLRRCRRLLGGLGLHLELHDATRKLVSVLLQLHHQRLQSDDVVLSMVHTLFFRQRDISD
jgi:hypothetical protein